MWFKVGEEQVQIPDTALSKLDKLIELIPYRCTCKYHSIYPPSEKVCFFKIIAIKQYLESKINPPSKDGKTN